MSSELYTPHRPTGLPDDLRLWAREMRGSMTDAEALVWRMLRGRRLLGMKFRRQHPLGRFILDFYCDEKRLCIELDGSQHADQKAYDEERDAWIRSQGIQVLRFWNNQVLGETDGVMEAIYQALVGLAIPLIPNPSPACGRREQN